MLPTEVRKENLAVAYSIIGGIPANNFHLDRFCSNDAVRKPKPTCGTIGCTLGWLAMHPYFKAQGLYLEYGEVRLDHSGSSCGAEKAAEYLFGQDAFDKYFGGYEFGTWDNELQVQMRLPPRWQLRDGRPTQEHHKTLALARLKRGYQRIHK